MRASKAKELRKTAKAIAVETETSYVTLPGNTTTVRLTKTCFRGIYKALKKNYQTK